MIIPKESHNIINLKVEEKEIKLKVFLNNKMNLSSRLFKKLIRQKNIFINNKPLSNEFYVYSNDIITIKFEKEQNVYKPQEMDLNIIYEDVDVIAINKEPNILVHPTKNHPQDTITNGIVYYFKKNNIDKKVRLVNRLDMDTSGILIVAKNSYAHGQMAEQFRNNIIKKYIAVVKGVVKENKGIINLPIMKSREGIKQVVDKSGKESITEFEVVERFKDITILSLKILTGRTHQIRVHLSYLGHPIIGDSLYGEESDFISRQALHSYYLKFNRVRDKKEIELKSDLPYDIKALIEKVK
ncbi:RluA family pseudouridine synthase [Senegalia massiliensis]|uniref:Pseudouridine synthase n=1 Tax=Senegalia massiliensis TaxID=1720316 RepID=A0A845QWC4_9CLOT|nr:RluA family pseudouridine synthase [Senegalia massiliensis]NBI05816.1 RluA family pseudouridine synthase [Senegalia massiliensis]